MPDAKPQILSINIPCRDDVNYVAFGAILQAVSLGTHWWRTRNPDNSFELTVLGRCHIVDARTLMTREALAREADYVVWIDDDMVPPPQMIQQLIEKLEAQGDADYVGAVAYKKQEPYSPCCFVRDEKGQGLWLDPEPARMARAELTGFACLVCKGESMRKVWEHSHEQAFAYINGMGEDASFFDHVKALGQKLYIDTSMEVGHVGPFVYGSQAFKSYAAHNPDAVAGKLRRDHVG